MANGFGFHSGSIVEGIGPGVYRIGVEAIIPKGNPASFDFEFALPAGKSVALFQGTSAFRAPCAAQFLATLVVNGHNIFPMNAKLPFDGVASVLFVSYDGPVPTGDGKAHIHLEADPVKWDKNRPTTWEFQGMLWVE